MLVSPEIPSGTEVAMPFPPIPPISTVPNDPDPNQVSDAVVTFSEFGMQEVSILGLVPN